MAQIELQLPISKTHLDFSNHLKLSKGKMVKMASLTLHVLWKHLEYLKSGLDCKTVGRVSHVRVSPQSCSLFSASLQTFCLTVQTYLNTGCFAV